MWKTATLIIVMCLCPVIQAENEDHRILEGKADYERTIDETRSISKGAEIMIRHAMGDVEVASWEGREVRIKAYIEVQGDDAEEYGNAITLDIDDDGDPFTVTTEYPSGDWEDISFGVRLEVKVPNGHPLQVECSFGQVALKDIRSKVKIEAANGPVTAESIHGDVSISASFGQVKVTGCTDRVEIVSSNGPVVVAEVGKEVAVKAAFGSVKVENCDRGARIEAKNGAVHCRAIAGDLVIGNLFGEIKAAKVGGSCTVTCRNGAVILEGIRSDLSVENSFGSVNVTGAYGNVSVENMNGGIKVRNVAYSKAKGGEANSIELKTSFGAIDVTLPDPPSFELDASTTFGRIESDFKLGGFERGITSERCKYKLGDGKAAVTLETSNGAIRIKKEAGKKSI